MKLSRVLAGTAGVALVGASAFAFAAPASAADIVAPAAPFAPETNPYSPGWFTGGGSVGSSSNDAVYGLNIQAGPLVTDTYQVLNGTPVTGDLTDLVDSASISVTRGVATFQIPVFGEPGEANQQFTTLRPAAPNTPGNYYLDSSAQWVTSQALPGYAAGATATLAEFEAVLAEGEADYQILAFGAAVGNGFSGSISQIIFAGNTHQFRPAATGTQSATTVTLSQYKSTGVVLTIAGLVPGEPVILGASTPDGGGGGAEVGNAGADGTFVYTAQGTPEFASSTGLYEFFLNGDFSGTFASFAFTVTADVAAAPATPAQLAATGADLNSGIIAGGILLLAGAGFALVATRRRLGAPA